MTFLDCQADLTNTIFSDEDLSIAREHLSSIILGLDPPWLKKPVGVLGEHWKSNALLSVCFLINMAITLHTLANDTTQKSNARLKKKFEGLLRLPDDKFQENYNEFQAGRALAEVFNKLCPLHFLEISFAAAIDSNSATPCMKYSLKSWLSRYFSSKANEGIGYSRY